MSIDSDSTVVDLARSIEAALEGCIGILGLDPQSRLSVPGRDGEVRGVDLRRRLDANVIDVDAELTGVVGANLPTTLAAARGAVHDALSNAGRSTGNVRLRITDIGSLPLVPRALIESSVQG